MRYAIISDVHGNLHALKAVLEDAKKNNAEKYLLLGDYFLDCPYPNEVIETVRSIPGAAVIKGNKDDYLLRLTDKELCCKQMAAARWNRGQLTAANAEYLMNLPETLDISENGMTIHLMHSSNIFYRKQRIQQFYSSWFRDQTRSVPFSHDDYLAFSYKALLSRPDVMDDIETLPEGIYLFGHNHLQFHASFNGRVFINPGSCGVPLDNDTTASYTQLDIDHSSCRILERRVPYDTKEAIEGLRSSSLSTEAPEWRKIVEKVLLDGLDYFNLFLMHVYETGRHLGDGTYPVADRTWEEASLSWDFEKMAKRQNK